MDISKQTRRRSQTETQTGPNRDINRLKQRHKQVQTKVQTDPNASTRRQEAMKGRRNHANLTVVAAAVVFCVAVAGGAGYFVYTHTRSIQVEASLPQLEPEARVQSGTLHDPAGRQAELDALVKEGMLTFSINATPTMRDGEANLLIENPPDNGNRFVVTIHRDDTGDKIYQSGYLDPEQYIESAPLDAELTVGEYPCTAYFDAYRISDNAYIGRAAAKIVLYVQG